MTNIKLDIVFDIFFLTINNVDINLQIQNLQYNFYTTKKVLSTTKRVKLIETKEFEIIALYLDYKIFIIYIIILNISFDVEIYLLKRV